MGEKDRGDGFAAVAPQSGERVGRLDVRGCSHSRSAAALLLTCAPTPPQVALVALLIVWALLSWFIFAYGNLIYVYLQPGQEVRGQKRLIHKGLLCDCPAPSRPNLRGRLACHRMFAPRGPLRCPDRRHHPCLPPSLQATLVKDWAVGVAFDNVGQCQARRSNPGTPKRGQRAHLLTSLLSGHGRP